MRFAARLLGVGLAACAVLFAVPVSAAPAPAHNAAAHTASVVPDISHVDCNARLDFLEIWHGNTVDCYADRGFGTVNFPDTWRIDSGNNAGWVILNTPQGNFTDNFNKFQELDFSPSVTVIFVNIN